MSSIGYSKAFDVSIDIINLYKYLKNDKKEFVMSNQLLRAGTSIGANLKEGLYAQTKKDFLTKVNIALKEAAETEYWLELLVKSDYVEKYRVEKLLYKCEEIIKILVATVKTLKYQISIEKKAN